MTFALIRNAVNFHLPFVDSIDAVEVEFMRWRSYWLRHAGDSLVYNTLGVLLSAKEIHTYPSSEVLHQILTTGPVTTGTNERSFSALRYLETYLRFTTKEALVVYPTPFEGWEHSGRPWSPRSRATPQGLDQRP